VPSLRTTCLTAAVLVVVGLLGCGGSGTDSNAESASIPKPFRIWGGKPPTRPETSLPGDVGRLVGPEPKPLIPSDDPPDTLALEDLLQGVGLLAEEGSRVTVQYAGFDYASRKKFISSWDEGKPFVFKLGSGRLIEGLEEGILEMEVGDRRELVIPPEMTRGPESGGQHPPNSHLVYVVDLLAVG